MLVVVGKGGGQERGKEEERRKEGKEKRSWEGDVIECHLSYLHKILGVLTLIIDYLTPQDCFFTNHRTELGTSGAERTVSNGMSIFHGNPPPVLVWFSLPSNASVVLNVRALRRFLIHPEVGR